MWPEITSTSLTLLIWLFGYFPQRKRLKQLLSAKQLETNTEDGEYVWIEGTVKEAEKRFQTELTSKPLFGPLYEIYIEKRSLQWDAFFLDWIDKVQMISSIRHKTPFLLKPLEWKNYLLVSQFPEKDWNLIELPTVSSKFSNITEANLYWIGSIIGVNQLLILW